MAKKVVGMIKLQIPGGQANPAPPVGPALGIDDGFGLPGEVATPTVRRTALTAARATILFIFLVFIAMSLGVRVEVASSLLHLNIDEAFMMNDFEIFLTEDPSLSTTYRCLPSLTIPDG